MIYKVARLFQWVLIVITVFFFLYLHSMNSAIFNKVCSDIGFLILMIYFCCLVYYYPLLSKSKKSIDRGQSIEIDRLKLEIAEAEVELKELKSR